MYLHTWNIFMKHFIKLFLTFVLRCSGDVLFYISISQTFFNVYYWLNTRSTFCNPYKRIQLFEISQSTLSNNWCFLTKLSSHAWWWNNNWLMPFLAFQSWGDASILCSLAAVSFANWNESILCIFVLCALLLLIILNKKTRVHMSYGLISVQCCTNKKSLIITNMLFFIVK